MLLVPTLFKIFGFLLYKIEIQIYILLTYFKRCILPINPKCYFRIRELGDVGKDKCYRYSTIFGACCYKCGGVFLAIGNEFYIRYLVPAIGLIICKDDCDFVIVVVEPLTVRLCAGYSADQRQDE